MEDKIWTVFYRRECSDRVHYVFLCEFLLSDGFLKNMSRQKQLAAFFKWFSEIKIFSHIYNKNLLKKMVKGYR